MKDFYFTFTPHPICNAYLLEGWQGKREPKFGKVYTAIGFTDKQFSDLDYLVMDDSYDCYFYSHTYFEIVVDEQRILDPKNGLYVHDLSLFSE